MRELDTSDEVPLEFTEILGENRLTDDVRRAYIWAALVFFSDEEYNLEEMVEDNTVFTEQDKALAKSVSIRGPFYDQEKAEEEAIALIGVVCTPLHKWTVTKRPMWVVCLSN